jgi:Spy/CpxP family protein refolding chaperone
MPRHLPWVPALVLTGVATLATPAFASQAPQGRTEHNQPAAGKDGRDKTPTTPTTPASPTSDRERWKWWLYDRAELGITDQQSTQINQIFETTIPKLRESRQELDRAEDELAKTIKESKADTSVVSAQLDRVQAARATHDKTRTLMLYKMHTVLSADQRIRLEALRARQDAARRDRDKDGQRGSRRFP